MPLTQVRCNIMVRFTTLSIIISSALPVREKSVIVTEVEVRSLIQCHWLCFSLAVDRSHSHTPRF